MENYDPNYSRDCYSPSLSDTESLYPDDISIGSSPLRDGGRDETQKSSDDNEPPFSRLFIVCGKSVSEQLLVQHFSKCGIIELNVSRNFRLLIVTGTAKFCEINSLASLKESPTSSTQKPHLLQLPSSHTI